MPVTISIVLHRLFGGARLEMMTSKDSRITFADIAGIDQVKAEIIELVQFLKNPKKFTDLGARSPAGVLLVGPPGTGKPSLIPPLHSTCTHILHPCSPSFLCRGFGAMHQCMLELCLCVQLACHNRQGCLVLLVASGNCGDVCSLPCSLTTLPPWLSLHHCSRLCPSLPHNSVHKHAYALLH